jgi:glycosyltransferase involved in cell wall biosynthesis
MQLSIVIPEYNEIENLKSGVLDEVKKFLIDSKLDAEVIISDDGSDDGSLEFSENYSKSDSRFSVLTNKHGGKASALLKGIEKSKGEWVLITDMDQSTPIFEVLKLLQYSSDYEIIIGSRGAVRSNTSVLRKLASYIFSTFRKSLVLSDIEDTQCGFKLLDS